jgi:hypothetical protein
VLPLTYAVFVDLDGTDADWLTLREVAARLHVSLASVYRDCRAGVVPCRLYRRHWFIPRVYLDAVLAEASARGQA